MCTTEWSKSFFNKLVVIHSNLKEHKIYMAANRTCIDYSLRDKAKSRE